MLEPHDYLNLRLERSGLEPQRLLLFFGLSIRLKPIIIRI
jgi:hypothetical protein